ncbi:hypothetical protein AMK68_01970 [candidate division KD3-62 bacterium DG_56]|uniref:Uncharacterized protein n=1 Tax=candidate division KD3-62 bacterium DG_56 TaxID=1704032 RepID=A0A0S7XPF0_9BACT|nr:MAG: hypothetical protein AMK68_01970 [candidate division KD3-62 bacterium DG_56]
MAIPPVPAGESGARPEGPRLRARGLIVGILLLPPAAYWIFQGEIVRYTFATWAAPFYNAIYILFALTLINLALMRWLPRLALNYLELFAIYVMVSVGSAVISSDMMGILVTIMPYPAHFASERGWTDLFQGVFANWLMVKDPAAVKAFYEGQSTLYTWANLRAWAIPVLGWSVFSWVLLLAMLCTNALLRKQWVERERLTFPIIQLPMAMAGEPRSFFRNRLMWMAFAFSFSIVTLNGFNYLYPWLPKIPINRVDYPITEVPPWRAMGDIRVAFYFFAISLGFLMPLDLSFSLVFFYLLFKLEHVAVAAGGWGQYGDFPYYDDQAFGAYMAIFFVGIWASRRYLAAAWRTAFHGSRETDDSTEPMRYRSAFIGLIGSFVFLVAFSIFAGISPLVAVLFFVVYFALAVMITRIRTELGFPVHDMHNMGPQYVFVRTFGAQAFDNRTLGMFSLYWWFNRVYRSHPMPHQLEGMRMAGTGRGPQRDMLIAMLVAGVLAAPICFWAYLHNFYVLGAGTANVETWALGYGRQTFPRLERWLTRPEPVEAGGALAMLFGFGLATGLALARMRFVGFPLHPLAYAVANSWGMQNLWLPVLIGFLLKLFTLKGFGLRGYRIAIYGAFGLMLGEFASGCSWTLYGIIRGIRTYDFWP